MRTMTFQRKIQRIPESVCPAFTKPAERTSVRDTIQRRRSTVIDADNELDGVFEWFTGASYRLARSCSAGLEFWNHHEFPMPLCTSTRHILSGRRFITKANAGSPRWGFFINCQLDRLSAMKTKNSPRTTVTFWVTSTKILCAANSRICFFDTHRTWHFAFFV